VADRRHRRGAGRADEPATDHPAHPGRGGGWPDRAGRRGRRGAVRGAAAAFLVAVIANLAIALLSAAGLLLVGLPVAGSVALGLAIASAGLVFATVALVTAQVASVGRAASGTAGALLGLAFLLRALGDSGPSWLSWLSPIGWAQQVRAFAGERWWVFALPVALGLTLLAVAAALLAAAGRRAGLRAQRPGPPVAPPRLAGPLALAWRLQRARCSAGRPGTSWSAPRSARSPAMSPTCSATAGRPPT